MTEDPSAQRPPIPPYDPAARSSEQDSPSGPAPTPAAAERSETERAGLDEVERKQALKRLQQKREFRTHLTVYWLVMTLLVAIWLLTGGWGSYFWPVWPMLGWGLAVAIHGGTLVTEREPTEEEIAAEAARMRARRERRRLD